MTLHAVYRLDEDNTIFVSDFRVTRNTIQSDMSYKLYSNGRNIGLFLSGDVGLWKVILNGFDVIASDVTIDNLFDIDGVLKQHLLSGALQNPQYSTVKAIGFVTDDLLRKNVLFELSLLPGIGVEILPIEINSFTSIGAGPFIPNLDVKVNSKIKIDLECYGNDYFQLAVGMRGAIKAALKSCGPSAFKKFGVSSHMSVSTLEHSHFKVCGEVTEFSRYTVDAPPLVAKYSFSLNEDGQKVLTEYDGEQVIKEIPLQDIHDIQGSEEQNLFDPEKNEDGINYIEEYHERSFIHLFHQWIPSDNGILSSSEDIVHRSLKKIKIIEVGPGNKRIRILEELDSIFDVVEVCRNELLLFSDVNERCVLIDETLITEFENDFTVERIFDHPFLSKYIPDYRQLFYKGNF